MTLGALVVLAGLVLAGLYLPSSSRTHAKAPDATAVSPTPDVGSRTVTQPAPSSAPAAATAVPNSTQPAPPPLAVADNPASTQPQIPPVTAPHTAKPDIGQKTAPSAAPHAGKLTAKHNAMAGGAAPAQSDAGTAPPNDAAAPGDAPDSLDAVERDVDQLSNRAAAVSSGLNRLQQQQSAAGYGLRGDMVERGASMNANLAKAEEAMRNGNLMRARRFARMAENDIDILERFLGR
jgi:hypothetical protein